MASMEPKLTSSSPGLASHYPAGPPPPEHLARGEGGVAGRRIGPRAPPLVLALRLA